MLSIGNNQKLNKKIAVFNTLCKKTCPGRTSYCERVCYAQKSERQYPDARAMRTRNTKAITGSNFVRDMIKEIQSHKKLYAIRVFESGDYNSQQAIDNWFEIARAFPQLVFLSYTKSFMYDFSQKPDNFSILFSIDATTTLKLPNYTWNRFAYTVADLEAIPSGYVHTCNKMSATGTVDKHYCGTTCFKCWHNAIKNIYFLEH